jgi:hypothetical protein
VFDDDDNDTDNDSDNTNKNQSMNKNKNSDDGNNDVNHSNDDENAFWLRTRYMLGKSCSSNATSLYNLSILHQAVHVVTQHNQAFGRREGLWH